MVFLQPFSHQAASEVKFDLGFEICDFNNQISYTNKKLQNG